MPTNISIYSNAKLEPFMDPENASVVNVKLPNSINYTKGTLLGEVAATPGTYKAYASGSSDGSQYPRALLMYDVSTDSSGNITYTATASQVGGDLGQTQKSTQAYYAGTFDTRDLVGLDANAMGVNAANGYFGRLIEGTVSAGILRLG